MSPAREHRAAGRARDARRRQRAREPGSTGAREHGRTGVSLCWSFENITKCQMKLQVTFTKDQNIMAFELMSRVLTGSRYLINDAS